MVVDPAVSVGSVKATGMSPLRVRAALTAVRSSVICAALMTVAPGTSGLSLKLDVLVKVTVTARAALIVTLQVPVPVPPPPQPVKVEAGAGAAAEATATALGTEAAHVAPQEVPAGALAAG